VPKGHWYLMTALPHTCSFYGKGICLHPHTAKYLHAEKSELIINKSGWGWEAVGAYCVLKKVSSMALMWHQSCMKHFG